MKKTIIIISVFIILAVSAGLAYLNNVFLPRTAKSLIVKTIENTTQKKASLGSVRINIFKGIVLKDLVIYDNAAEIVSIKEASCIFWFWGLMQKKIVIPGINLRSALIYLQRRNDGSFNLADLFVPKEGTLPETKGPQTIKGSGQGEKQAAGFTFEVYKINITDSVLKFNDLSLVPAFNAELSNVDISIYLSLPNSLKFKGSAQYPGNSRPNIYVNGEFKFDLNELKANLMLKNIPLVSFQGYYRSPGLLIKDGEADLVISLGLKDNLLDMNCGIKANKINLQKENIAVLFSSDASINLRYSLLSTEMRYRGRSVFTDTFISGLEYIDKVSIKKCSVDFSDTEANSNDISANVFDVPVSLKIKLTNFSDPKFKLTLLSAFELSYAQKLAQEKFNFILPGQASGPASVSLNASSESLKSKQIKLDGSIDLAGALLKLDKLDTAFQNINGSVEFTQKGFYAKDLAFTYQDMPYKLNLLVKDFASPAVSLGLSSEELSLKADLNVDKSRILINNLSGKYINSDFKASGSFDTGTSNAGISGSLSINLEDLSKPLNKFKDQFQQINPKGKLDSTFSISGDLKDIKSCSLDLNFSSPLLSFYGFKAQKIQGYYKQIYGISDIPSLSFDFYEGKVNISARANLKSDNLPYSFNLSLEGVKIEKLKNDTEAKSKDISGIVNGDIKLNGFSSDLSKLYGAGSLDIAKGKLWELDLFKGMGRLLFAKDLANIVFYEGSSNFIVQDKYIVTDNLTLKSNIASLTGRAKIGFDSTIDASLNIDIIDEMVPLSGTFKDVTTTVIGKSGKFATISITGTLKEPKYKFKPAVDNIIRGIADVLKKAVSKKERLE